MKMWNKKLLLILIVFLINGLFFYSAKATTSNNNINVQVVVPSGGNSTPIINTDTTAPTISNLVTSPSYNSASVSWSAADNVGISSINFDYGVTQAYGLTATPNGSYVVNLSSLTSSTLYYFKITVTDTSNNSISQTGSFTTLSAPVVPDTTAPTISNVLSSTNFNTSTVTWSATDNKGISSLVFEYGESQSYGRTSPVTGSYQVELSGLVTNTIYYFKITVTDTSNNSSVSTGNFRTKTETIVGPIITNVSVNPSVNSAIVNFTSDKNTTAQVNFGETNSLGSSASDGASLQTNHAVTLLGLSPGKTYYYQIIVTDGSLISTTTIIQNFRTLSDTTPPPDVSNLKISSETNQLILTWTNPSLNFNPDFAGVKILRKINTQPSGHSDSSATVVYVGKNQTLNDGNVLSGFNYFYSVYSYDDSGNYSSGNTVNGQLLIAPTGEICNNSIDDNGDGNIDCNDQACLNNINCKKIEQPPTSSVEIPTTTVIAGGNVPICSDNKDNDNDLLVDFPTDPGCIDAQDNDEYNPPTSTVPEFEKLTLDKLKFFAGNRQIELITKDKTISGLSNSNLSIGIKKTDLIGEPKSLVLRIGDSDQHKFVFENSNNTYYADVLFPLTGRSQAYIELDYGFGQIDSLNIDLVALDFGRIADNNNNAISGVNVVLHLENGSDFPASIYGQKNPLISNNSALIGWMVPNGRYYISATKDNYYEYNGQIINVTNNVFNSSVSLISVPPKIKDVINPDESVVKNVVNVAKNIAEKTSYVTAIASKQVENAVVVVQEIAADPEVKKVANTVVAPTAVGVAAAGTVALVSWADIIPLLRFLFLQPLLVLGRGKREKWGTVYNSLSKLPVDLALVRLINIDTNKLVQTKVTSSDGHYFFTVNEGRYRLEIRKGAFSFPSSLLKGFQTDGNRVDIYHGEEIVVSSKGSIITANIPLDPVGEKLKTPFKMVWGKILRRVQNTVSWIGLIVTLVSLYISPTWYMWVLLGVHLFMTFTFKRLAKPPVSKGWGIVYDETTKKPLSKVIARLFDSKFNKLVATEITGPDGKYYFMAGDNQYYVSYDRDGYQPIKTDVIDLKGKESDTIAKDVGLKKK